jgi:hypothetical protein
MKLEKLKHDTMTLADFFEEGLGTLGALCERSWHDRLDVIAEGPAARLWNNDSALLETSIQFPPPDSAGQRDAAREVFPGCPLTFRLAEALRVNPPSLERVVLRPFDAAHRPPSPDVAERLWHADQSGCSRWRLETSFVSGWHFSLIALVRCEIQAIDQHWSLHRLAISLPEGRRDDALAAALDFAEVQSDAPGPAAWPGIDPASLKKSLRLALEEDLAADLEKVRQRQESYLRRELTRIEEYFDNYEGELSQRRSRAGDVSQIKLNERLAAAQAERERRRDDQIRRHEIRIIPHFDTMLLLAEPAWSATVSCVRSNTATRLPATFVPRSRRWELNR